MVGAGGGRWSVSNVVCGRCFALLLVGGRWLMVGGRWAVVLYYAHANFQGSIGDLQNKAVLTQQRQVQ